MRFENMTNSNEIKDAIALANSLFAPSGKMMSDIRVKNDFKFGAGSAKEIFFNLLKQREPVKIFSYKSKLPWSKAVGYFDGKAIHINSRKIQSLTTVDLAGLLIHEYSHFCGYAHGNNYKTKDKCLYSVPYFLSENVSKWI